MSENDISAIEAEERELAARLERLRRTKFELIQRENEARAKAAREKELERPIVVRVTSVHEDTHRQQIRVETESDYREDVVALFRTFPSRYYGGGKKNSFSLEEWNQVDAKLKELKNVRIEATAEVLEQASKLQNQPMWLIEKDSRWLHAIPSRLAQRFLLRSIPGAEWDTFKQRYKIPLTEVVTVFKRLEGVEGVVWSDEASAFVMEQLKRRASLDSIATMEEDPEYAAFDLNGVKLRPFQTVGARFIEAANGKALLGDEMGLGKTPQAIAYAHKMGFKKVIVIVPASLKPNWYREILRFTGKKAKVLYGAEPTKYDMLSVIPSDAEHDWFIINYDIVGRKVVEPKKIEERDGYKVEIPERDRFLWAELISMANPDLVIVDEGHYIKNTDSNRSKAVRSIQAPRFVFLTGTPVLNRPGELWAMLTKIDPEQFPAEDTFIDQYTFDGKRARSPQELHEILKPLMIRRLKKDVYQDLPAVDRRPIYHELSPKALKLYNKVMAGVYEMVDDYHPGRAGDSKKVTSILAQIQRLKMVCAIDKAERTADLAVDLHDQTDESEHRKVIIFTQYKAVAYKISRLLGDEALSFVSRRGSDFVTADAGERDRLVQQFQTDDSVRFLVVTEKTTKEGHNITAAGHVIFNDLFWTPAGHDQAIGRAYGRISDMHGVDAYFLIAQIPDLIGESIEEWIWELLAFKQGVIEETVDAVEASRDSSIAMQLIERVRDAMGRKR